jgi:two-component system, NarL family, response regulator NreC
MAIRIILVDDHHLFRQGLKRILETQPDCEVVAEGASGLEAIELAKAHHPDVMVLDIAMKDLNGIEAAAQLLKFSPQTAILMLSMYSDERYVLRAVRAGARGYVLKDTLEGDLVESVRALAAGKSFFSPAVARIVQEGHARQQADRVIDDRYELLTERERQLYQAKATKRLQRASASACTPWKRTGRGSWRNSGYTPSPNWC